MDLQCSKCGGDGQRQSLIGEMRRCVYCDGVGSFPEFDSLAILRKVFVKRKCKVVFRKSSAGGKRTTVLERRAYYVWRLARFHGGADVSMPVVATMECDGDPVLKQLDELSERVAKQAFGTHKAAAYRWGGAFGMLPDHPPTGLPATAYEGGPVADENKPEFELAELF